MFSHDKDRDIPVLHVCFQFSKKNVGAREVQQVSIFFDAQIYNNNMFMKCFHNCSYIFWSISIINKGSEGPFWSLFGSSQIDKTNIWCVRLPNPSTKGSTNRGTQQASIMHPGTGPKTGSNRAQNTATKIKWFVGFFGLFKVFQGFLLFFNYFKMAN